MRGCGVLAACLAALACGGLCAIALASSTRHRSSSSRTFTRIVCTRRAHRRCVAHMKESCRRERVRAHGRWHTRDVCHRVRRSKPKAKAKPKAPVTRTTTTTTGSRTSATVSTTTTVTRTLTTSATETSSTSTPLPSRLEVDENDQLSYSLSASHTSLATGTVEFNVYNFGEDPHTFAIVRGTNTAARPLVSFARGGTPASIPAGSPGAAVTVDAQLSPGTYTLFCTLSDHAALGMRETVTVG